MTHQHTEAGNHFHKKNRGTLTAPLKLT